MTMGSIYVKRNAAVYGEIRVQQSTEISPIIISQRGVVRFPERVPSAKAVHEILVAVQENDFMSLNDLLIKHRFYVLPGRMTP